tara:strand:+ start:4589 stop:5029 length:441 start_codon:yes stop_codon:yes gene_type:complete
MDKKRKCIYCEKKHNRRGALYCSAKCCQKAGTKKNQEAFKMGFQDGHRHEASGGVDDFAIPTHSVPHKILQEAKHYHDQTNCLAIEGHKVVEDVEEIMRVTYIILQETMTEKTKIIQNRRSAKRKASIQSGEFAEINNLRKFNKYF